MEMDLNMLSDLLVRLASLGASGVCIFAIFWTGWLITRIPPQADPERHRTIRFFMVICVFIALVSAGSGVMNAMYNQEDVNNANNATEQAEVALDETKEELQTAKVTHLKTMQYLAKSINQSTRAQLIKKAPAEVQTNIRLHLKNSLDPRFKLTPMQPKSIDNEKQ